MSHDEAKLVQRAKDQDPAAFAEIYEQCYAPIYRYISYQVTDTGVVEDLSSEVFVRLVEKIDHFTYQGRPLLAWLYTIARNLITDYRRRATRVPPFAPNEELIPDGIDTEATVERKLAQRRAIAALPQLTEDQRQVILLKFIEGLDNATVAATLGKSVNAVKALQHRALASLRRILERDEKPGEL